MNATIEILECGHVESPHASFTPGWGTDPETKKRYCYACCHKHDLEHMAKDGRINAYLSGDGLTISNWPGAPLAKVTREWVTSAGGFLSGHTITRIQAVAADGSRWYGRGPGRGMYICIRRAK